HTRFSRDWSADVCSSDLPPAQQTGPVEHGAESGGKHNDEALRLLTLGLAAQTRGLDGVVHDLALERRHRIQPLGFAAAAGVRRRLRTQLGQLLTLPSPVTGDVEHEAAPGHGP